MLLPQPRRRFRQRALILVATLVSLLTSDMAASEPEPAGRTIPDGCSGLGLDVGSVSERGSGGDEKRWNRLYLEGVQAIHERDLDLAQRSFCGALLAALDFGPRDWRFAETLDELGLVGFLAGDLAEAEAMQGAALAEMLLAGGPEEEIIAGSNWPRKARSSVAIYADRLRLIHTNQGKQDSLSDPSLEPHRLLRLGYLPLDEALARRLDWLISQYLLTESFGVAKRLEELQIELEGVEP